MTGNVNVNLIQAVLLAFAVVVILMPAYIRFLNYLGMGKQIQEELPDTHQVKAGVPTMGGLMLIGVIVALFFFQSGFVLPPGGIIAPLATLILVGGLGAFDDYLNARTGEGISARQKMLWLVVVAVFAAYQIQDTYAINRIAVPFIGFVYIDRWLYVAFAAFAIIAAANGVNLTDGLDGLAGGTLVFAFVAFLLVSLLNDQPNLAVLCALIVGALVGFLWFNVHPAQVFMGDSGSLAFGATLAVTALITGQILILPIIGLVFVVETLSVMIQVGYFKSTHGRRIFRMSPLHLHYQLIGWDEEKITLRFWIIGIIAGLIGVTLFLASIDKLQ
jgi:phospho-N-acetylmuramoyl-pentapeptide-transferase